MILYKIKDAVVNLLAFHSCTSDSTSQDGFFVISSNDIRGFEVVGASQAGEGKTVLTSLAANWHE